MPDSLAELIRIGFEEAFAGNPARLVSLTGDDYVH